MIVIFYVSFFISTIVHLLTLYRLIFDCVDYLVIGLYLLIFSEDASDLVSILSS